MHISTGTVVDGKIVVEGLSLPNGTVVTILTPEDDKVVKLAPHLEKELLEAIDDALKSLVDHPGIGTKVETGRSLQVRRFLLNRISHYMYYRVRRAELEVLSVWHTSREHGPRV